MTIKTPEGLPYDPTLNKDGKPDTHTPSLDSYADDDAKRLAAKQGASATPPTDDLAQ